MKNITPIFTDSQREITTLQLNNCKGVCLCSWSNPYQSKTS